MIGIGVDILSINRMRETIIRSEDNFINKVFTPRERKNSLQHCSREIYYGGLFAAKEAVFKTFCIPWTEDIKWQDIEILKGEYGNPEVKLFGSMKQIFTEGNCSQILLSISWELDYVTAFACLI